ncbi:hypothetical protein E2562_033534 [Oryza meyeriana var. granulata]|uniref:Uncharacterized protein n=1 Tax=Oryza meyeriana var. granulata TaxID=110450 RepID=A0A6G1ES82_9ORYZ|nr:hypothetical protein E2562_033534 [Oryza meyeriana var. granulata]
MGRGSRDPGRAVGLGRRRRGGRGRKRSQPWTRRGKRGNAGEVAGGSGGCDLCKFWLSLPIKRRVLFCFLCRFRHWSGNLRRKDWSGIRMPLLIDHSFQGS